MGLLGRKFVRVALLAALPLSGCASNIGQATPQELEAYQAWRQQVTPQQIKQVDKETERHTDWSPKQKVLWSIVQFQHMSRMNERQQHHAATQRHASSHPAALAP
jgi:hypothetical protein